MTDSPARPPAAPRAAAWPGRWTAAAILAAATLAGHGWSLGDGFFFDDHLHRKHLQEMGWSFSELLATTTIEPVEFIETWWQEKTVRWQYPRPASVLVMKVVHELSGGQAWPQHAVSLALHFATACMVFRLCVLLTHSRRWALVGGLLFVVYSHSIFGVAWIAAQNTVLQTCLLVAALLCWIKASGLDVGPRRVSGATGGLSASAVAPAGLALAGKPPVAPEPPPTPEPAPVNRTALAWTFVLWGLALLSRENAIILPGLAVAFDWCFGGSRQFRARLPVYALFAVVGLAFLYWRLVHYYHPIPEIYFRKPDGDGYALWALAKLLHYLTASVWLSPMTIGPTGRYHPFSEVPGDCALMIVILAAMGTGYWRACRHVTGFWIWPAWLVLAVLPVVPVLATPHAGYMSGVGFAIAMVLGPGTAAGTGAAPAAFRWSRRTAIWFLIATTTYIPIYRGLWDSFRAAERYTIATMTAEPAPAGAADIYFLNLPLGNIYAKICLEEDWGPAVAPVRFHVLTYAPSDVLRMSVPCRLEQLDDHRFTLSVPSGDQPYFSGLLGRFLIDAMRKSGRLETGKRYLSPGAERPFDVLVAEADGAGVRKLEFRFRRPLWDPAHRFYLATEAGPAAMVKFTKGAGSGSPTPLATPPDGVYSVSFATERLRTGRGDGGAALLAMAGTGREADRRAAWEAVRPAAKALADAWAAPVGGLISEEPPSPADLSRIREWWSRSVDDEALFRQWIKRNDFAALRETRDALLFIRGVASAVVRTDLYLTGPPYPGPR